MLLYSIRHQHTGLFYLVHDGRGRLHWNATPIFWKTIDGTVRALRRLGSDFTPKHGPYRPSRQENWTNFDKRRLKHIEVIVTDVSINGEKTIAAAKFFRSKALSKASGQSPANTGKASSEQE